jgi:PAS domain S-box-containing protein
METNTHRLSILIVEDNPGDLFLLEELLRSSTLQYQQLFKVSSTNDAINILQQEETIDLVLLDLTLPDSSGLESYQKISPFAGAIPIIVLTGLIDTEIALETMASGAQDYLIKGEFDEKMLDKSIQYSIERKKSQENLRESNERFEFVIRATNDVIWDIRLSDKRILWGKENLKRLFGYELKNNESDFEFWVDNIHPEDRERVYTQIQASFESTADSIWEAEYRFRCMDGEYRYVVDRGHLLYKNGKAVRMIGSMQDITERKLAELQVVNSERRFRSLVQNGSDMIKILDQQGDFIFASPNVEKVLGFKPSDMLGSTLFDYVHPDEAADIANHFNTIKGQDYHEIGYFRFKDATGEWRWLETKLANLLHDPAVRGIVSNSRDVTEKKKAEEIIRESEERYRSLFNNNPMPIYIWDIETLQILEANTTAQREYGYTMEEFHKLKVTDIRRPEHVPQFMEHVYKIRKAQTDVILYAQWEHVRKGGDRMFMDVFTQRITYKNRQAVLSQASNVTEKVTLEKKLQEEREARQKEITEAVLRVQEKERYDISRELHDNVNQQLTVAMMYIATAEKGTDNSGQLLKQSSTFIYNAIEEIRKLSKVLVTPLIKDFGLCKAIEGLVEDFHATNALHIDFFYNEFYEDDISYEFKLNVFRIVQEQMNNIVKHAQAKQVVIELYREELINLAIIDDGVGFDTTQKRSGIGLNNIKTRVGLYMGTLDIQSQKGDGCRLKITFPISKDIMETRQRPPLQ